MCFYAYNNNHLVNWLPNAPFHSLPGLGNMCVCVGFFRGHNSTEPNNNVDLFYLKLPGKSLSFS